MTKNQQDVIIVGSGPAGWTAALYASRAMLQTMVISGPATGGQLMITNEVENFPGFPDGLTGPELMDKMQKQAEKYGTKTLTETVKEIVKEGKGFALKLSSGETMHAKSVILATGAQAKWLGLDSETKFQGKGVSGCAICDGFFFKDQVVAVVGGGNTAMEDALFLTQYAKKIYVIHRRDSFRAEKILQERLMKHKNVEFLYFSELQEIKGGNVVESIDVINNQTQDVQNIELSGVFIAIGHKPTTDFVSNLIELDKNGYAVVKHGGSESSCPGLFLAGDVADKKYRQAITAAGMGCMAALDANAYIKEN